MSIKEKIYQFLSKHTPRKLLYWMVIRAWAIATTTEYTDREPDKVKWHEVCKLLEK